MCGLCTTLLLLVANSAQSQSPFIFDDSTQQILACGHITSGSTSGWDDGTVYIGDVANTRYHLLIAIRDTAAFVALLDTLALDSAKLALTTVSKIGSPGDLLCHMIRRDSTGMGVYSAYNDNLLSYCRSIWPKRKGATASACPDSILWQTPGALGANDFNNTPFATLTNPAAGVAYEIDVTTWISGLINHVDSVSNGIMLLTSGIDGAGSDFISIRNIHPFHSSTARLQLKIWFHTPAMPKANRAWLDNPSPLK